MHNFKLIQTSKAPQQIVRQIRGTILKGELKPGERLASEAQLMEMFGVSKATLREALRALECFGLLEIRKGANGGAFVTEVGMDITHESLQNFLFFKNLSLKHICEIRNNLEPYAAAVAAEKVSRQDLEILKGIIDRCKEAHESGNMVKLQEKVIEFHRVIALATENPILIMIKDFLDDLLDEIQVLLVPDLEFADELIASHDRIYEALENGDAVKAQREALNDVLKVEKALIRLSKRALDQEEVWPNNNR